MPPSPDHTALYPPRCLVPTLNAPSLPHHINHPPEYGSHLHLQTPHSYFAICPGIALERLAKMGPCTRLRWRAVLVALLAFRIVQGFSWGDHHAGSKDSMSFPISRYSLMVKGSLANGKNRKWRPHHSFGGASQSFRTSQIKIPPPEYLHHRPERT